MVPLPQIVHINGEVMKPQIPRPFCCQFGLFMTELQTRHRSQFSFEFPHCRPPRRFKKNMDIKGSDPQKKPASYAFSPKWPQNAKQRDSRHEINKNGMQFNRYSEIFLGTVCIISKEIMYVRFEKSYKWLLQRPDMSRHQLSRSED